jgi:hypothetical protein
MTLRLERAAEILSELVRHFDEEYSREAHAHVDRLLAGESSTAPQASPFMETLSDFLRRYREGCISCGSLKAGVPRVLTRADEYGYRVQFCDGCWERISGAANKEFHEDYAFKSVSSPGAYVYYAVSGSLVKIGVTTKPPAVRAQEVGGKLAAWERGGLFREREMHARWAYLRRRGEWFKMSTALRAHVAKVASNQAAA